MSLLDLGFLLIELHGRWPWLGLASVWFSCCLVFHLNSLFPSSFSTKIYPPLIWSCFYLHYNSIIITEGRWIDWYFKLQAVLAIISSGYQRWPKHSLFIHRVMRSTSQQRRRSYRRTVPEAKAWNTQDTPKDGKHFPNFLSLPYVSLKMPAFSL